MSFFFGGKPRRRAGMVLLAILAAVVGGCGGGDVVATVNGRDISARDLDSRMAFLEMAYQHRLQGDAYEQARGQILDMLVEEEIVVREAGRRRLVPDATKVEAEEKKLAQYLLMQVFGGSERKLEDGLKTAGLTHDYLRTFVKRQMSGDMLYREVTGKVTVTAREIEDYYNANKERFRAPEQVKLLEIQVATPADGGQALEELRAGADFRTVAGKYSVDPQAKRNGGDRGYVVRQGLLQEVADAAFALEAGETSGLIKSQFAYHILKVEDRKPAHLYSLAEVRENLRQQMLQDKQRQAFAAFFKDLSGRARVERKQLSDRR